jgi:hypothetical protein
VLVRDPSGPPTAWTLAPAATRPAPHDATAGVACSARAGEHLVALIVDGEAHHGRLARWPLAQVATGALSEPQWWTGAAWRAQAELTAPPAIVLDDGATECSLHQEDGVWVHVSSRGFGATPIALRTAPALEGPWSDPLDVFTPPESAAPDAFVYAGKAHPELEGGGALVVTYADNSFTFSELFDPARAATLYWPHVARLTLRPRP